MELCPSQSYCGRVLDLNGTYGECGSCPWGWKVQGNSGDSICKPCNKELSRSDWFYLGFMAILPLLLHSFFIEYCNGPKRTRKILVVQHLSSVLECSAACLLSMLLTPPVGSLQLKGCGVSGIRDWYTMLSNPTLNYTNTLRCTQEAVYPLYTLPFIYYAFSILCMAIVRSALLLPLQSRGSGTGKAAYAALYFYPALSLVHAVLGGVIYYAFPSILLLTALSTNALHFALYEERQSIKTLLKELFTSARNVSVLGVHMVVFAFSIAALTEFRHPLRDACLMLIVPVPPLFYILTVTLTDPSHARFDSF